MPVLQPHRYWAQKLFEACQALAGPQSQTDRLVAAFRCFAGLQEEQVPDGVLEEFRAWRSAMTRIPNEENGAVAATLAKLSPQERTDLAEKLPGWLFRLTFDP